MNAVFLTGTVKFVKKTPKVTMFSMSVSRKDSSGQFKSQLIRCKVFGSVDISDGQSACVVNGRIDEHEYQGKKIFEVLVDQNGIYTAPKRISSNGSFPPGYPLPPADDSEGWRGDTPDMMPSMPGEDGNVPF